MRDEKVRCVREVCSFATLLTPYSEQNLASLVREEPSTLLNQVHKWGMFQPRKLEVKNTPGE